MQPGGKRPACDDAEERPVKRQPGASQPDLAPAALAMLQQQQLVVQAAAAAAQSPLAALGDAAAMQTSPTGIPLQQHPLPLQQQLLRHRQQQQARQLLQGAAAAAAPPGHGVLPNTLAPSAGLQPVPAAPTNLAELITVVANAGSLWMSQQQQQQQQQHASGPPAAEGSLQQLLLRQLQPSLLVSQHQAAPAGTQPGPVYNQQRQQQQQGLWSGFAPSQLQALQQLQAIGSQVAQQQAAAQQVQQWRDPRMAAQLVQSLTAAAHQMLHLPPVPTTPPGMPAVGTPLAAAAAPPAPALVPAPAPATLPAAAAALASLAGGSPAVSAAAAAQQLGRLPAVGSPAIAASVPAQGSGAVAAVPAAVAAAPPDLQAPLLQGGLAAMAALAALGGPVAGADAGAAAQCNPATAVQCNAAAAHAAAAAWGAGLLRLQSVRDSHSPVGSEETVESEESEESEGHGDSEARRAAHPMS